MYELVDATFFPTSVRSPKRLHKRHQNTWLSVPLNVGVPQIRSSAPVSHLCPSFEPHPFITGPFVERRRRRQIHCLAEPSRHGTHFPVLWNGRRWICHTGPHWGTLTCENTSQVGARNRQNGPAAHHASRRRGPARGRVLKGLVGILRHLMVPLPTPTCV